MHPQQQQTNNKFSNWLKKSITARLIIVGFLTLILLIPLMYIENLIAERFSRQKHVVRETSNQWGNQVTLYGPILKVPYKTFTQKTVVNKDTNKAYTETQEHIEYAYFFPEKLDINGTINPEKKGRSIYTAAVFNSTLNLTGAFLKPSFKDKDIKPEHIIWNKSKFIIQTSNLKGVNSSEFNINSNTYELNAQYSGDTNKAFNKVTMHTLETKSISNLSKLITNPISFNFNYNVKGSKHIQFIPIGKTTQANLKSTWKDPNFFGQFLPYNPDKLTKTGFDAKWKIPSISRAFSQSHFSYLPDLKNYASGVEFKIPVNQYLQSERSIKYGFLVIGLTFLVFFLIQILSNIHIHPFQYLMIGLALTMFYTLLISISEHSSFFKAYIIAGTSVVLLISIYSKSILKNIKFSVFIGLSLTALYTFIYVIIQLENYALLVGSIGLFIILATVMFISRKIDWNHG